MRPPALIPAAIFCLLGGANAWGAACTDVKPDASGQIVVRAHVPPVLPLCYAFAPPAGQKATIDITEGDTMGFGLEMMTADGATRALGDNHHSTSFVTEAGTYHVLAGPANLHGDPTHEFTLTITLK